MLSGLRARRSICSLQARKQRFLATKSKSATPRVLETKRTLIRAALPKTLVRRCSAFQFVVRAVPGTTYTQQIATATLKVSIQEIRESRSIQHPYNDRHIMSSPPLKPVHGLDTGL